MTRKCAAKCNVPELINLQTAKTFGFLVAQFYWPRADEADRLLGKAPLSSAADDHRNNGHIVLLVGG